MNTGQCDFLKRTVPQCEYPYIQGVHKALKIGEFPGYEAEFSG